MLVKCFVKFSAVLLFSAVFSHCAKRPTAVDSRVKTKLSLRLAGGAPISSPNTDEYNPQLLLGADNFLYLVFGSNRACNPEATCTTGLHYIFITRSITAFDGINLPFFNSPVALRDGVNAGPGTAEPAKFAATINGSQVTACVKTGANLECSTSLNAITGEVTIANIANSAHLTSTPIGVEAAGQKLIVLDGSNNAFEIGTASGATALPGLNNASSAVGVREANSGYSDAYFVVGQFGTTASRKDSIFGPLVDMDIALASSGLEITSINSFFNSSAAGDLVLFSANDGLSDDMYVVTSHTAEQLWNTTGFFGPGAGGPSGSIAIDLPSGPVGSLLTITSIDFDLSDVSIVTVNGTPAIIVSSEVATARVMVMPGSTSGIVTVTAGAGTHVAPFTVSASSPITTQQGTKLVGSPSAANANQERCALSADGNTAIIGGLYDTAPGAAWIFTRSGTTWSQQAKLVGTGNSGSAEQGQSVAISADGNTAVVSGHCDNTCRGALWVYTRSGTTWTQQGAKLVAAGPPAAYTFMGWQIALSADGNTVIAGGYGDATNNGAAWVFTRSSGSWTEQAKLVGTGNVGAAVQGWSVAISADGNTALVGGKNDDSNAGAAWVFTRSGSTWSQQGSKLVGTGATGAAEQGSSVALSADGNTALIGGSKDNSTMGAAWAFTRSGPTWSPQGGKITVTGNIGNVELGHSLALSADGDTAVIGGYRDNTNQGAAWMFTRSGSTWTQGAKLIGTGAVATAPHQASTVAISADGNTVISGGYNDNTGLGAAWIFVP